MGVVKRHQSVAPVKYFKDSISFVIVSVSGKRRSCVIIYMRFILEFSDF